MPPSPPPGSFPFTSGNFDFPQASTLNRAMTERGQPRMRPRRGHHLRPRPASRLEFLLQSRQVDLDSITQLRRSRAQLLEQRSADTDSTTDILDSLSNIPLTNSLAFSPTRSRSPASELEGQRRQTKRRKLDYDTSAVSEYDGFKYGYKGQVVSGRLRMEITSCDGGEYEKANPSRLYKVQNVLNNDKSVYCSESSSCNLLLKHMGGAPFALDRVVIRAPDRGFTAPVQEGLIFVSMSPDELISGTAAYQIQYCTHSPRLSPAPSTLGEEQLSLREAVEDPYIWQHSRQRMQDDMEERIERLRLRSRGLPTDASALSNRDRRREERRNLDDDDDVYGEHCDYTADEPYSGVAGVSAPTPPPFTVTAETEVESEENEELPSPAIMADRLRRESRWRPDSDEDDQEEDELLNRFAPPRRAFPLDSYDSYGERRWRNERYFEPIRATRLGAPSRIEPTEGTPEVEGLIAPHARFFIAKHKNKITIKFNPAVSGKYILLKLWSPTHDGNIDIESVQFYGYSGPRFFPATKPR